MLDVLRQKKNSIFVYVFLGAIIFVFVMFFGTPITKMLSSNGTNFAAVINGDIISEGDFQSAYTQRFQYFQSQWGEKFDAKMAQQLDLKRSTLDSLINNRLLAQEAKKRGIVVSDEELRDQILNNPVFKEKEAFSEQRYKQVAAYFSGSVSSYEKNLKTEILASKMNEIIQQSSLISENELKSEYSFQEDQVNLEFIKITPEMFEKMKNYEPTSESIQDFMKNNAHEIETNYEENKAKYNLPKKIHARHILKQVAENASPEETEKAFAAIKEVKTKIDAGEDFIELAKKLSDGPSAKDGGDLGFFSHGTMVKPFEDVAFSLEIGKASEPVKTQFGYHIIKVEAIEEGKNRELDNALKEEISKTLLKEKFHTSEALAFATDKLNKLKSGMPFTNLLDELQLQQNNKKTTKKAASVALDFPEGMKPLIEETSLFDRAKKVIPKIGLSPQLMEFAFKAQKAEEILPEVLEIDKRFFVVQVKERLLPDWNKFETEKESISRRMLDQKRRDVTMKWIEQIKETSAIEINQALIVYPNTQEST